MDLERSVLARAAIALLLATSLSACFSFGGRERSVDRRPVVDTGMGATIIDPGGTAPTYQVPPTLRAPESGSGGSAESPGSQSSESTNGGQSRRSSRTGAPPAGGDNPVTFIGGAQEDQVGHVVYNEEPIWFKYVTLPFALAAVPFKAAADSLRSDPEPGPELPRPAAAPPPEPPAPPVRDIETQRLEALERELDERRGSSGHRAPTARSGPAPPSIADELARLERGRALPRTPRAGALAVPPDVEVPAPQVAGTRAEPIPAPEAPRAQGIVDRDGDGRIDQWIYRVDGRIAREAYDDDFDGKPDRTVYFDPDTQEVRKVEEDGDGDGTIDAWTDYRDGRIARRRADADGDGIVDTWTFYRDGELARHERDTTGDGFRDLVGFYEHGRLTREQRDADGDGRSDVTLHYDGAEQLARREEDTDGDGSVDTISYFEEGRLARRELLAPDANAPTGRR